MTREIRCVASGALAASILLAVSIAAAASARAELLPAPEDVDARTLARRAEGSLRSDRTYLAARMVIESPRLTAPRKVAFESWEDAPAKRSFIRIREPAKDAGTGFLKLHPNLWMYIPRVERTVRVPPSMMLQSWMGSDFTNDDLVRESSELDDYDHAVLGIETEPPGSPGRRAYVVDYIPHEEAPVVWGKIRAWIDIENGMPLAQDFFDEDGERLRELRFGDFRELDGRHVPHRWELTPLDKQGHKTLIELLEIEFDAPMKDDVFTKRNLKRNVKRRR